MVEPGTALLGPGQIRDANRSMLIAAATKAGAKVWIRGEGGYVHGHCMELATRKCRRDAGRIQRNIGLLPPGSLLPLNTPHARRRRIDGRP